MKRTDALNAMKFSGYHADKREFTRLLIENRVSIQAAKAAFSSGATARANGMGCKCPACSEDGRPHLECGDKYDDTGEHLAVSWCSRECADASRHLPRATP